MTTPHWNYLAPNPKSAYRQMFVKGTRIRARVLYGLHMSAEEPMQPEVIAADYDLPLDAVLEAIAYCQSNPREIAEDFAREERRGGGAGPDKTGGEKRGLFPPERGKRRPSGWTSAESARSPCCQG